MNAAHRLPTPAPDPGPHLVPKPPRLNWIILLSLEIVTVGVFGLVWLVVQAAWIKRITGEYRSLVWAIVNLCALPFLLTVALVLGIIAGISGNVSTAAETVRTATQSYRVLFFLLHVITVSSMWSQRQGRPLRMELNGFMTVFLGTVYFQYSLNDVVLPDAAELYGPPAAPPMYVQPAPPASLL